MIEFCFILLVEVMLEDRDLQILGFSSSAKPTPEELKKAYKAMAMRWHPDRPHNRDRGAEATAHFRVVKAAYAPRHGDFQTFR